MEKSKSTSKMAHEINSDKAGNNESMSKALTLEKSKRPLQVNIDKAVNTNTAKDQKKPAVLHCV